MNFQKYFKSTALISNPLCSIKTYKDILNLATGQITRAIKKRLLTGEENISYTEAQGHSRFNILEMYATSDYTSGFCTHYNYYYAFQNYNIYHSSVNTDTNVYIIDDNYTSAADFKAYLAAEYADGTPVTIWYILETPETEQITVPSGLSGTVEGYLTYRGTPTPTDPIYPVANDAIGWYAIKNYVRDTTWTDVSTYSRSGGSWSSSLTKKRSRKKK